MCGSHVGVKRVVNIMSLFLIMYFHLIIFCVNLMSKTWEFLALLILFNAARGIPTGNTYRNGIVKDYSGIGCWLRISNWIYECGDDIKTFFQDKLAIYLHNNKSKIWWPSMNIFFINQIICFCSVIRGLELKL